MPTTRIRTPDHIIDDRQHEELPPLSPLDRAALRVGLALILWGQRHAEHALRAEQARSSHAGERAAGDRDAALTHRTQAGPTW